MATLSFWPRSALFARRLAPHTDVVYELASRSICLSWGLEKCTATVWLEMSPLSVTEFFSRVLSTRSNADDRSLTELIIVCLRFAWHCIVLCCIAFIGPLLPQYACGSVHSERRWIVKLSDEKFEVSFQIQTHTIKLLINFEGSQRLKSKGSLRQM